MGKQLEIFIKYFEKWKLTNSIYLCFILILATTINLQANSSLRDSIDLWNKNARDKDISMELQISFAKQSIEKAEEIQYYEGAYQGHINLGIIHSLMGNFDLSMNSFHKAIMLAEDIQNTHFQAEGLRLLAGLYINFEKYEEAKEALQKAIPLYSKEEGAVSFGHALNAMGTALGELEEPDSSFIYYKTTLSVFEEAGAEEFVLYPIINVAGYYLKKRQPESALMYLERALELNRKFENIDGEAVTLANMGTAFAQLGKFEKAFLFLEEALEISKLNQLHQNVINTYKDLSEAYEMAQDYPKAMEYLNRHYTLKDSLYNQETKSQIAALEVQYETLQKERSLLESEAMVERLRYQKQRTLFWTFILGGGLLFAAITFYLFFSRQKISKQLMESELQRKRLESEQLKIQLESKGKDLTNFALDIARKNSFGNEILEDLKKLNNGSNGDKEKIKDLIIKTTNHLQVNEALENTQMQVEKVNQEFFEKLNQQFPKLSKKEKQLCALLRINLSSKDIASINNISPKSVEVSRYRLRKKLNLQQGEDLVYFLQKI